MALQIFFLISVSPNVKIFSPTFIFVNKSFAFYDVPLFSFESAFWSKFTASRLLISLTLSGRF